MRKIIGVTVGTPMSVPKIKEKLKITADEVKFADGETFQQKYENGELTGKDGESGVYVGSGEMPEHCNVQIDPDGVTEGGWVKLDDITFSEDGTPMSKTYSNLGGMTEFLFKVEGLTNGSTDSGMNVSINGYSIKAQPIPVKKTTTNYCYVELKFNGLYWKFVRTGASNGPTNWGVAAENTPYNIDIADGLAPAETMTITQHGTYCAKAGKLIIYGRVPKSGSVLRVYDSNGTEIAIPSIKGGPGDKGDKPTKGEDYWTDTDKQEIVDEVIAALPAAEEASF